MCLYEEPSYLSLICYTKRLRLTVSMLASAHAPVGETWEAQPGSQQTSGHGQQAPRTSAGIDFTLRERERWAVSWALSASASDTALSVTTHGAKLSRSRERSEDRWETVRRVRPPGGSGEDPLSSLLSPVISAPDQWLTRPSVLVKPSSVSAQGYQGCQVRILTPHWHGWLSLVCSEEIDLSCICYILFSPQSSPVLQWNVQFTLC